VQPKVMFNVEKIARREPFRPVPSQAGSACYAAPLPSQSAPSLAGLTAYGSPQSSVSQQPPSGEAGVAGSTGYLPPQQHTSSSPTPSAVAAPQHPLTGQPPPEANRSGGILSARPAQPARKKTLFN